MKLTFYGGAGEIGGNKILLTTKKAKVFFDFGEPFDRGAGIYSGLEYVEPRSKLGLKDYFEFDMVPKIMGLYSKEDLSFTKMKYVKPEIDAVFLSHLHSDHAGDVCFIDPEIPVYLGHGTRKLNEVFNEIYPNFKTELNDNEHEFKSGNEIKIKDIIVIPVHVDHSIPGAYGFIIKTDEGNIAYTGDYRFHGYKSKLTEDFMQKAAKSKVKILITEGTRVKKQEKDAYKENMTEEDVENRLYDVIKKTKGITFVHFSFRNLDRVRSLCNATERTGKILVANPGFFYTVDNAKTLIKGLPVTNKNKHYKVFNKDGDVPDDQKRILNYAKPYLEKSIDYKWVKRNSGDVVIFMTASELSRMIDIQPKKSTFVFSMSEHYLEGEGNEEYKECLENWMSHFGVRFEQIHCSGHADIEGVKKMVNCINPEAIIPVHTEGTQEEFKKIYNKIIMVTKGETYSI